jgi:hypothetical protein
VLANFEQTGESVAARYHVRGILLLGKIFQNATDIGLEHEKITRKSN